MFTLSFRFFTGEEARVLLVSQHVSIAHRASNDQPNSQGTVGDCLSDDPKG